MVPFFEGLVLVGPWEFLRRRSEAQVRDGKSRIGTCSTEVESVVNPCQRLTPAALSQGTSIRQLPLGGLDWALEAFEPLVPVEGKQELTRRTSKPRIQTIWKELWWLWSRDVRTFTFCQLMGFPY